MNLLSKITLLLPEKPMQRGAVDPDLVVEKYDKGKAMDGTTLFPDNHNIDEPRIVEVNMLGEVYLGVLYSRGTKKIH